MQPILSKDSANFAEYTICEDKNRKLIPYLTIFYFYSQNAAYLIKRYALFSVPPNVWRIFSSFSACKYFKERLEPPCPRWGVSLRRREAQCGAVLHEVRPYSGGGLRNISISIFLPLSNKRLPFWETAKVTAAIVIEPSGEYFIGCICRVTSMVSPG